jgi:hypothetical protein
MNDVVDAEARKDDVVNNVRQTRTETATIVAATAFGSSLSILLLSRLLNGVKAGWAGTVFSIGMCGILGLVAPASVLYFWNPKSPIQLDGEETQLHKVMSRAVMQPLLSLRYSPSPIHPRLPHGLTPSFIHCGQL